MIKQCRQCGESKPLTPDFWYRQPALTDGFKNQCKQCVANTRRVKRSDPAKRRAELDRDKQYRDTDAYRAKHAADERIRRNRNPEAFKAYRRDYYARELKSTRVLMTPEERRNSLLESLKRHWRNNREQYRTRTRNYLARKRGAYGTHSDEDIEFMLAYQQFLCFWCGHDISDGKHHVDHLIPLSKGGSNGPDNLVGACSSCNKSKGAKLPDEFLFLSNKKQVSP